MSAVSFSGLRKRYAELEVLSNISTELVAGTVTAIIGRSGSGKSTLLKVISGLVRPDSGEVRVFGSPIDYQQLPRLRRGIGYLVQGGGLFPHLDARANISLMARLEGWSEEKITDRCSELMAQVQLPADLAERYPHELSGGQQQRVALCRAMMLDPPLLLLDEAFAALDPLTRMDVHEQLLSLQAERPRSMVLVTHDMREALKLADRILVLDHGSIVASRQAKELQEQYPDLEPETLLLTLLEAES